MISRWVLFVEESNRDTALNKLRDFYIAKGMYITEIPEDAEFPEGMEDEQAKLDHYNQFSIWPSCIDFILPDSLASELVATVNLTSHLQKFTPNRKNRRATNVQARTAAAQERAESRKREAREQKKQIKLAARQKKLNRLQASSQRD